MQASCPGRVGVTVLELRAWQLLQLSLCSPLSCRKTDQSCAATGAGVDVSSNVTPPARLSAVDSRVTALARLSIRNAAPHAHAPTSKTTSESQLRLASKTLRRICALIFFIFVRSRFSPSDEPTSSRRQNFCLPVKMSFINTQSPRKL